MGKRRLGRLRVPWKNAASSLQRSGACWPAPGVESRHNGAEAGALPPSALCSEKEEQRMRYASWFVMLAFGALACSPSGAETTAAADKKDKEGKGVVVDLDGLRSRTPADWKEEAPSNRMRLAQFRLPAQKGDKEDAELVIFKGLGGSAKQNVERWKGQFQPPEGKKIDDVSKVEEFKVSGADVTLLDVHGTYLSKNPPFAPNAKVEKKPDYRMLAAQFETKNNIYHIKLVGPAKTIEHCKTGFDEWLKNFK
jgi:hypothetical protein